MPAGGAIIWGGICPRPPGGGPGGPVGLICGGAETCPLPPGVIICWDGPPTPRTGPCKPVKKEDEYQLYLLI